MAKLVWTKEMNGHRAVSDETGGEYIVEMGGDGMWRLFEDGRFAGQSGTLTEAKNLAETHEGKVA